MVNTFRLPSNLTVELAVPYWRYRQRSATLASARLSLHREQGTGVGPRENADLIRAIKASRGGTCFVSSSLRLRELGRRRLSCLPGETLSVRRAD